MRFAFDRTDLERTLQQHRIGLLVAFGSRVSDRARPDSDLDLGVLTTEERPLAHRDLAALLAELQGRTPHRVDVVDLAAADTLLRYALLRHHEVLYVDDRDRWVTFVARTLIAYDDLLPHLDALVAGVGRRALRAGR